MRKGTEPETQPDTMLAAHSLPGTVVRTPEGLVGRILAVDELLGVIRLHLLTEAGPMHVYLLEDEQLTLIG